MSSPLLWGPNNIANNLQGSIINSDKSLNKYNGVANYILNGHAELDTTGWATYALSEAVTFQDTGDTVTLNNHGLSNNTGVSFSSITSTTGISVNTLYYVVGATTNTFQVATSVGGSALALTTNGSGTLLRSIPVTGTGGSPTVTWTQTTTSPLDGTGSFVFTKDAANRMGEGASYNLTIDSASQSKVLNITFDYIVGSGTFVAGSSTTNSDLIVYIYDVTNAVMIQPSTTKLFSNSSTIAGQFMASFQTPYNSTSYRLIVHCASPSTSAYTVKFDNVAVSPSNYTYGTPITDWASYTPVSTQGFGTVTTPAFWWRRVGDSIELSCKWTNGTVAASEARISLPNGYTIDSTKMSTMTLVGEWAVSNAGSSINTPVIANGGLTYVNFGLNSGASNYFTAQNGSSITGTGSLVSFWAKVPVLGLSSSVQMSDNTAQNVVAASFGISTANLAVTANTTINFPTLYYDTVGMYNAGTITIPVPGKYRFSISEFATSQSGGINDYLRIYKNGSLLNTLCAFNGGGVPQSGTVSIDLIAGDLITIRNNATDNIIYSAGIYQARVCVERISGPQTIGATDTVAASYWLSANFAASTTVPINFDSKEFDYTGSVTTSATAWKFTAPVAGLYAVIGVCGPSSVATSFFSIYKNGSLVKSVGEAVGGAFSTFAGNIKLVAGDYIDLRPASGQTIQGGASTTIGTSWIQITKIGNY